MSIAAEYSQTDMLGIAMQLIIDLDSYLPFISSDSGVIEIATGSLFLRRLRT